MSGANSAGPTATRFPMGEEIVTNVATAGGIFGRGAIRLATFVILTDYSLNVRFDTTRAI